MTQTTEYQGPLAGLNVIDFGHYYAGPMVGMLLADQGATVIRIVRPGKPELLPQQYRLLNRNKKLLPLDLKTDEGKAQALSLIEKADVVIENFRPGVMKRLGLDYARVKDKNPGLIYLSLPGFASTDKERAHIQAWEGVIAAASGIFTEAHFFRQQLNFPPLYASVPLSSAYGSMYGAIAVMAVLVAREESGCGTVIEAPLVDAGWSTCIDKYKLRAANPDMTLPDGLKPLVYSPEDSNTVQLEKLSPGMRNSLYIYDSSDGRKMLVFTVKPKFAERLYKALGIDERLKREGYIVEDPWKGHWDYNLAHIDTSSSEQVQRAREIVSEIMLTRTADEWDTFMEDIGVPFTYLRTRNEWLALEPLLKSGVLTRMNDGNSLLTVPGRVADMSGPSGVFLDTSPKEPEIVGVKQVKDLLQHAPADKPPQGQKTLQKKGDLLKGLKVLDLCSIVAGPTAAYTLAQYGAEVIRAEPPESFNLPLHLTDMLEVNQGKRSIVMDMKTAPGREIFQRMVRWADIVMHNRLDDTAKRLGVTPAQLQEINPKVVVCQMSALGGTWRNCGGWENRVGYDPIANMPSGLLAHYGSLEYPMVFGGISADLMGGFGLALSSLLGIYQQRKTGYAGEGLCSLARATTYNQLVWMISENGSSDWGEARGQFALGEHWWARLYQCADRWIYVETTQDRASVLAETVAERKDADVQALESSFAKHESAYWLEKLDAADIACHLVMSADDIYVDENIRRVSNEAADETANGMFKLLRWDDHPCGKPIIMPEMTWVRVGENQSYKRLTPTPKVGANSREVLLNLGYSEEEVAELIRIKVVHEYLPAIGSKDKYFFEPESLNSETAG